MAGGGGRDRAAYELDGQLVLAARAGDDDAFAALFNRWFDSVLDVCVRVVGNRDVAAEVAQDTFLVLWQKLDILREPSTFGAFALRTARNRALNRADRERRSTAVDDEDLVPVIDRMAPHDDTADQVTQREGDQLVWAASAALGAKDISILDLHLRHGLTAPELADELGVTPNNAHQLVFRMKKKLGVAIEAWVIWRGGTPSCERLVADLGQAGIDRFSAQAVRVVNRHVEGCDDCGERKAAVLAPEAMFAAVPIMVAAPQLRERVADALRQHGVPMPEHGSGSGSAGSSSDVETTGGTPAEQPSTSIGSDGDPAPLHAPTRLVLLAVGVVVLVLFITAGLVLTRDEPTVVDSATPGRAQAGQAVPRSGPSLSAGDTGASDDPPETVAVDGAAPGTELDLEDPTSTTAPAGGAPHDPASSVAPSPTGPTSTSGGGGGGLVTSPTTASTDAPTPPAAPAIDSFTGTGVAAGCGSTQRRFLLAWTTSGATSVRIQGAGITDVERAPDGNALTACVPLTPQTYVLTATGPGGPYATTGPRTF